MARDYHSARQTALGFQAASGTERVAGGLRATSAEMGIEDLPVLLCEERSLDTPDEQMAQRAVLMLFDEFDDDEAQAQVNLQVLVECLQAGDEARLAELLQQAPCADWLSGVFLSKESLEGLDEAIKAANEPTKAALHAHLQQQRQRLVQYTDLMDAFAERTERHE